MKSWRDKGIYTNVWTVDNPVDQSWLKQIEGGYTTKCFTNDCNMESQSPAN